jgi:O-antigen/teichoic acid export membrane protein
MSPEIRSLGRHAAIYSLGNVLAKLASFLMLPIYTRFLAPADYGVLELLTMTIDLIGMLAGATLAASVYRFYAEYKDSGTENEVISTAAIALTGMAVLTAIVGMFASPWLSDLVLGGRGRPLYFRLFFLIHVAHTAELVPFLMCRALHRSKLVVTLNLARLVGLLTLNILFVVQLRMGIAGILYSNLIISTLVATGMTGFLLRKMGRVFSPSKFKEMARYAYPVAFVSLGNFFLVYSDRYFLNHFVGAGAVGIYSLAYRFGFILSSFVYGPFQQIWGPERFAIAKRPNAQEVYRRVFLYVNIALGGAALVIALFARDVLKVMTTPAFFSAYRFVPVILVVQILHHWSAYNNLGLMVAKTTSKFAWGSAVAIPTVLTLNFLLIPRYGIWGAMVATLVAYVVRFLVIHSLAQRQYAIHYNWSRIARLYAILVPAFVVRALLGNLSIVPSVLVGIALTLLAVGGVLRLVLNADERAALGGLIRSRTLPWVRRPTPPPEDRAREELQLPVEV